MQAFFTTEARTGKAWRRAVFLNFENQVFSNMKQKIANITLVVEDYDEAIKFYTQKLHFRLIEDTVLSDSKRWVLLAPDGSSECRLLLAKAANDEQKSRVGNQTCFYILTTFIGTMKILLIKELKL
jgi:hypothetical protein